MEPKNLDLATLKAIKMMAKTIKREHSVRHFQALDMAAQHFGYTDYRDLKNRIKAVDGKAGDHDDREKTHYLCLVIDDYTGGILGVSVY